MNTVFPRIERLPPYVFNIVGEMKKAARARGEDVIDFSMGNPDQPTPKHIVDKLVEASVRGTESDYVRPEVHDEDGTHTHRYSVSKGIPRLRKAMATWYKRRYDVDLNADTEVIATIGSKEGLAHLAFATLAPGDTVLVPNPAYPIHAYGFIMAGGVIRHVTALSPEEYLSGNPFLTEALALELVERGAAIVGIDGTGPAPRRRKSLAPAGPLSIAGSAPLPGPQCAADKYWAGLTVLPFITSSKCTCGPVERPVEPIRAIGWPLITRSPGFTSSFELWP